MTRAPRRYYDAPSRCVNAIYPRLYEGGPRIRRACHNVGCSQECFDARARFHSQPLVVAFNAIPPTHHLRVTVQEDLPDEEINNRMQALCRRLLRNDCEFYVDALHFRHGRRHDHIAVRYVGSSPNPKKLLSELVDRSFAGVEYTKQVGPIEKPPAAMAHYLVQDLAYENKRDVELPPEGFTGHLLRRSQGIQRPKKEPRRLLPSDLYDDVPVLGCDDDYPVGSFFEPDEPEQSHLQDDWQDRPDRSDDRPRIVAREHFLQVARRRPRELPRGDPPGSRQLPAEDAGV